MRTATNAVEPTAHIREKPRDSASKLYTNHRNPRSLRFPILFPPLLSPVISQPVPTYKSVSHSTPPPQGEQTEPRSVKKNKIAGKKKHCCSTQNEQINAPIPGLHGLKRVVVEGNEVDELLPQQLAHQAPDAAVPAHHHEPVTLADLIRLRVPAHVVVVPHLPLHLIKVVTTAAEFQETEETLNKRQKKQERKTAVSGCARAFGGEEGEGVAEGVFVGAARARFTRFSGGASPFDLSGRPLNLLLSPSSCRAAATGLLASPKYSGSSGNRGSGRGNGSNGKGNGGSGHGDTGNGIGTGSG